MNKAIVLGASGGMGYALVQELVKRGVKVTAFARNEERLLRLFQGEANITIRRGNAFSLQDLNRAVSGHEVIFHAINLPYSDWKLKLHDLTKNIIEAAKLHQTKLAVVDNIYSYGRNPGNKVSEDNLKKPHTKKGKLRLDMENMYVQSGVPYILAHFPDFYGPYVENSLIGYTLNKVVQHKNAQYVGDLSLAREHIYTLDGAKALVELVMTTHAYGQSWNIPATDVISGEEIVQIFRELIGYDKKVSKVTKNMLRLVGLFDKQMREFVELQYLYEDPVVLSGEKYEKLIGPLPRTPYKEGIQKTIDSMKML